VTRRYPSRPIVGIGVCVLRDDQVLLVRRARPPAQGEWSLPGGAQELGETAEAAARREVLEETAITLGPLHLAAIVDSIHPDAAGAIEYHYTIIDFAARWAAGSPTPGGDASDALWAPLADLARFTVRTATLRVIGLGQTLLASKPPTGCV
jgi:ADP-ribose pyrophosphatase YjhB (NUDIX family)